MIKNTSDYCGSSFSIFENEQTNELESKKNSFCDPMYIATLNNDLLDNALNRTLIENNLEDAKLLITGGACLQNVETKTFITIYKSNYQLYRWMINQLRTNLSQTPYSNKFNLLHELLTARDSFPPIKNHAQWLEDLEELVRLGFSPTQKREETSDTPLDIAFERKHKDACKLFVKLLGTDPKNSDLHNAILDEQIEKINEIIKSHPLKLYVKNYNRQTPFDFLIEQNKLNLLPIFAQYCHYSSPHFPDKKTHLPSKIIRKPILRALKNRHYEMAKFLWDMGLECVDLNEFNIKYNFNNKDKKTFKQLKSICETEPQINRIIAACESDDLQTFIKIFEIQPWLTHVVINERSCFGIAMSHSSDKIIDFLFKKGFSLAK
ncbi:MAG: hypothetical protein H0W50_05710 [Parachlamydiaceae bacterium]|nr:hypothetical protein [Parachlamydiaceae bacterium]